MKRKKSSANSKRKQYRQVNVLCTPAEKRHLKAVAKAHSMSMTGVILLLIERERDRLWS